jgi:hypothetical protein
LTSSWRTTLKDHLRGFFLHGFFENIGSEKRRLDDFFMLCLFGKTIGIPGIFNYYHLRLMPYYFKKLNSWKRRVLRERDFFDHVGD